MQFFSKVSGLRLTILLLAAAFCLIFVRLWWIACFRGSDYVAMAQNQRLISTSLYEYERGDILDRSGESLTGRAERVLLCFPRLYEGDEAKIMELLAKQDISPASPHLADKLAGVEPFLIARDLSEAQMSRLAAQIEGQHGLFCTIYHPRYSVASTAAHLIGYIGEANDEEQQDLAAAGSNINQNTHIGKTGIEKLYDQALRGRSSDKLAVAVDSRGQQSSDTLRLLADSSPNLAQNVRLTLDYGYQQIVEEAMRDKSGAAVLLDVKNGDVLALASSPSYDQSLGQPEMDGDDYLNKCFCYYPPASVFKLVLVAAALEEDITLDENEPFSCTGEVAVGAHLVHCWETNGHGEEDMSAALANSCNPYFITLGQKLGGAKIREYAWRLGLSEQILRGFAVNSQNMLDFNDKVPADIANASIGEKGVRATPLMLARMMAAIANDGLLPEPRLVVDLEGEAGNISQSIPSATPRRVISSETAKIMREMLINAVDTGTGSPVQSELIGIGGKTGTSQNFGVWFVGFFPSDEPLYAMAVYISNGTSGGKSAGGVLREVAEKIAQLEGIANTARV